MDLSGKSLLITGAARRIGRALALSAAHSGADIILHYGHSEDQAQETKAEIQALGREVHLLQADFLNIEQTLRLVECAAQIRPRDGL
ncbi:MAG: SDR family NAD(P)-dependent oxidoreductase, partial [Anaerolineales bacterium]